MNDHKSVLCTDDDVEKRSVRPPPNEDFVCEVLRRLIAKAPPKPPTIPRPTRGPTARDLFLGFVGVEEERGRSVLWVSSLAPARITQDTQLGPVRLEEPAVLSSEVHVSELQVATGRVCE